MSRDVRRIIKEVFCLINQLKQNIKIGTWHGNCYYAMRLNTRSLYKQIAPCLISFIKLSMLFSAMCFIFNQ